MKSKYFKRNPRKRLTFLFHLHPLLLHSSSISHSFYLNPTMASNSKQRSPRLINSRPLMLKDFLLVDDSSSCSSSGFNIFPRFPSCNANSPNLLEELHRTSRAPGPGPPPEKLRQSRSRSAAEAAISVLQKLLTSVKYQSSKKKPSPATTTEKKDAEILVQVRVKDILRWRSFRDLIDGLDEEEKALPLDCFSASPDMRSRFYASGGSTLKREGEQRNVGGEDPMMAGTGTALCSCNDHVGPAKSESISDDDEEQNSPVSVLHSPFRDDEDSASSFDQSLANVERTKQRLLESIQWLESLAGVEPVDSDEDEIDLIDEDEIDLIDEASTSECVGGEVDKEAQWGRFEEQRNQLAAELEKWTLNALLDELLFNLVNWKL